MTVALALIPDGHGKYRAVRLHNVVCERVEDLEPNAQAVGMGSAEHYVQRALNEMIARKKWG